MTTKIRSLYGSVDHLPDSRSRFLDNNNRGTIVDATDEQIARANLTLPQSYWAVRETKDVTELNKITRIGLENKGIYGWWRTSSTSPCPGSITYYDPQRNWQSYGKKLDEVSRVEKAKHELECLGYNDHARVAELLGKQEKISQSVRCYCDGHQGSVVLSNQLTVSWQQLQRPLMLATSLFRLAAKDSTTPELLAYSHDVRKVLRKSRLAWCIFEFKSDHWHTGEGWKEGHPTQHTWFERLMGMHIVPSIGGTPDTYEGSKRYPFPYSHAQVRPQRAENIWRQFWSQANVLESARSICHWLKPINEEGLHTKIVEDKQYAPSRQTIIEQEKTRRNVSTRTLLDEYAKENRERKKRHSELKQRSRKGWHRALDQSPSLVYSKMKEPSTDRDEERSKAEPWPTNSENRFHVISSSSSNSSAPEILKEQLAKRRFLFEGWRRPPVQPDGTTTDTSDLSDRTVTEKAQEKVGFFDMIQRMWQFLTGNDETKWMPDEYVMDEESRLKWQEVEAAIRRKEKEILRRNFGLKQPITWTLSDFLECVMPCFPESVVGADMRKVLRQNAGIEPRDPQTTLDDELKRSVAYNLMKENHMTPTVLSDLLGHNIGRYAGIGTVQDELIRVAPLPSAAEPAGCSVMDMLDPLKSQVERRVRDFRRHCQAKQGLNPVTSPAPGAISGFDLLERDAGIFASDPTAPGSIDDDEMVPWWMSENPGRRNELRTELAEVSQEYKSINRKIRQHRATNEYRYSRATPALFENAERTLRDMPCFPQTPYSPYSYDNKEDRAATADPREEPVGKVQKIGCPSHLRNAFGDVCQIRNYARERMPLNMYDDDLGSASLFLHPRREGIRRYSDLPLFEADTGTKSHLDLYSGSSMSGHSVG